MKTVSPKRRRYYRRWIKAHPERVKAYNRRYWAKHGYGAQYEYYRRNRKYYRAYHKRWKKRFWLKVREYSRKRDRAMRGLIVDYGAILKRHGLRCHICKKGIRNRRAVHFDHVVPLSRGGKHTASNIRPSHPFCNYSKHQKLMSEL